MLARSSYDQAYVDDVRQRIRTQIATFETLAGAAGGEDAQAVADFAPLFFGNLTLALEGHFVHRTRGKEAKKGALKELRARAEAVADEGVGVTRQEFAELAHSVFEELEAKFTE